MKRTHLLAVGSWLVACWCLVDCGSSDAPTVEISPGATAASTTVGGTTVGGTTLVGTTASGTTGATGPTTTGSTGAGGDVTTGIGTGSTGPTTGTGNGGSGNGGSGNGGSGSGGSANGGTGNGGSGQGGGTGAVDGGMCPAMQPFNGTACNGLGAVCAYPGFACTCASAGMTRDGGARNGWMCVRVRPDGGGAIDAGMCPAMAPANGSMCTTAGEVCPYARETCTCQMPMGRGMQDRWACTVNGRDGGGRGG